MSWWQWRGVEVSWGRVGEFINEINKNKVWEWVEWVKRFEDGNWENSEFDREMYSENEWRFWKMDQSNVKVEFV